MRKEILALFVILALSAAVRVYISFQEPAILAEKFVQDDSYYYFSEAKSLAQGKGITSNGVDPTNGFQPLWLFMIAPAFLSSDLNLSVNIVLLLATLLDIISMVLIYKIARRFLSKRFSLFAVALYGFNFFIMAQTISGLDVALSVPLVLAIFNEFSEKKRPLVLGLLSGLLGLARLDGIFLVAAVFLLYVHEKNFSGAKKYFLVVTAIVLPWFIWSFVNFGSVQQSSSIAVFLHRHGIFDGPYTAEQSVKFVWESFMRSAGALLHQLGFYSGAHIIVKIFIGLAATVGISTVIASRKYFYPIILFGGALILFYSAYLWTVHIRYLTPLMPFLIISVLIFFERSVLISQLKPSFILPALLLVVIIFNSYLQWQDGYYPWAVPAFENLKWVEENTLPDDVLGSFNSGILSYYSNRLVVNLDGLLNFDAISALKNKSTGAYMKSRNISYWIDGSFVNKSIYDEVSAGKKFDVKKESFYSGVLGEAANFTTAKEELSVVRHITGREMKLIFFVEKVNDR